MTSSLKLIGRSAVAPTTLTGTLMVCPAKATSISVAPSATGVTVKLSRLTSAGLAKVMVAWAVTSRVIPDGSVACTTNVCLSRDVSRLMSGG